MEPGNLLKIDSLHNEWIDKDEILLHACFQLLTNFVEEEVSADIVEWDATEEHRIIKLEIDYLYNWWNKYRKIENSDEKDTKLENKMLIRLINIRSYLWT